MVHLTSAIVHCIYINIHIVYFIVFNFLLCQSSKSWRKRVWLCQTILSVCFDFGNS